MVGGHLLPWCHRLVGDRVTIRCLGRGSPFCLRSLGAESFETFCRSKTVPLTILKLWDTTFGEAIIWLCEQITFRLLLHWDRYQLHW